MFLEFFRKIVKEALIISIFFPFNSYINHINEFYLFYELIEGRVIVERWTFLLLDLFIIITRIIKVPSES